MIVLARIVGGVAMVVYGLIWFPMAFLVALMWDEPKNWIAWMIVWINPLTIGIALGLFTRWQQRTRAYG